MSNFHRGRRLRRTPVLREMVRETSLAAADLIMPYFVVETDDPSFRQPIASMPGQFQLSLAELEKEVGEAVKLGLRSVILFGIPAAKDPVGSGAYASEGIVQKAIRMIKKNWPDLLVIADCCLCEYTSHGHCGIIAMGDTVGHVLNDSTLELLARTAVSQAEAGADIIAPSDMMDGRVLAIREALEALEDEHRFGAILRAKGILPLTDGKWLHFDYVPGESELRYGSADYTGRLCVIGVNINESALKELFGL